MLGAGVKRSIVLCLASVALFFGSGGENNESDASTSRAAARGAYVGWIEEFRTRPARACRRYLTRRARRQYNALEESPDCHTRSARLPRERYLVRLKMQDGDHAKVLYSLSASAIYCPSDEPMVLVRTDEMLLRRGRWLIDHFGFGRLKCMPRSRFSP